MLFLSLGDLFVLLAHLLIVSVQVALVIVVGVLMTGLKSSLLLRMLIPVVIQLFAELKDGSIERRHFLFMIFALFFANAFGLLSEILFGLPPLGILLV